MQVPTTSTSPRELDRVGRALRRQSRRDVTVHRRRILERDASLAIREARS